MPSASLITLSHVWEDLDKGGLRRAAESHQILRLTCRLSLTSHFFLIFRQKWMSYLVKFGAHHSSTFNEFVQNFSIVSKWKLLFVLTLKHESWLSLLAPFWRFNSLRLPLSIGSHTGFDKVMHQWFRNSIQKLTFSNKSFPVWIVKRKIWIYLENRYLTSTSIAAHIHSKASVWMRDGILMIYARECL